MVHVKTLERMIEHYNRNLKRYVRNHSEQFILIENIPFKRFKVTFYRTEGELEKATRKYEGRYGPTFLVKKIPSLLTKTQKELEYLARELHSHLPKIIKL